LQNTSQDFLDRLYHSSPEKQQEEGEGGQGDSLYDVVLTKSSQLGLGDVESMSGIVKRGGSTMN
jgi:hypothetical protein